MQKLLCPYCECKVQMTDIDAEGGACPECGAPITGSFLGDNSNAYDDDDYDPLDDDDTSYDDDDDEDEDDDDDLDDDDDDDDDDDR